MLIFVFLVIGLFFIIGCQQYFGQEARGADVQSVGSDHDIPPGQYELLKLMDIDSDGEIDNDDFFAFSEAFGKTDAESLRLFDYDKDGDVDNDDYFLLSENFGKKVSKVEKTLFVLPAGSSECNDLIVIPENEVNDYYNKGYRIADEAFVEYCITPSQEIAGDYNGNGCVDAKTVDGTLAGEDGEAFMKYYNDGDKRANLDGNGVVDVDDFFFFSEQVGKYACKEEPVQEMMQITFSRDTGFDSELMEAFGSNFYSTRQSSPTSAVLISSSHRTLNIILGAKNFIPAPQDYLTGKMIGTDKIWVAAYNSSAIGVYYENTNGITQLAGMILNKTSTAFDASSVIFIDTGKTTLFANDMVIVVNGTQAGDQWSARAFNQTGSSLQLAVEVRKKGSSLVDDTLWTNWTLTNDDVNSLGLTQSWEESDEVRLNDVPMGTRDEDIMGRSGIVLKNPKVNGASDKVRLVIPLGAASQPPVVDKSNYRYMSFRCYDGSDFTLGEPSSCKSRDRWWEEAVNFCSGRCNDDNSKCGVDGLSVRDVC